MPAMSEPQDVREIFEAELRQRGLSFSIDEPSGRHAVDVAGGQMLISLDNLQRDYEKDHDVSRISRFVDTILASSSTSFDDASAERLYWCLDRNDYEEPADYRAAVSGAVDRVLVHLSHDGTRIRWVDPDLLGAIGLSEADAGRSAFSNLARALVEAELEQQEIDAVKLGYLTTAFPFKSSLILAPNLKEIIGNRLGWPLLAVTPDRDFLYLWAARHTDFVRRVGRVVVNEYRHASYPISTEVYQLSDEGVRAIGAFPS
jgi:hypothetical protein